MTRHSMTNDFVSIEFDFEKLGELQRKFGQLAELEQQHVMVKALTAGALYLEGPLKVAAPVDTGFMRNAIYVISPETSGYNQAKAAAAQYTLRRDRSVADHSQDIANELDPPSRNEVKIGFGAKYTVQVEMRKPWIRPTVRQHADKAIAVVAHHLAKGIQDIFGS